jgi:hypothetical protein
VRGRRTGVSLVPPSEPPVNQAGGGVWRRDGDLVRLNPSEYATRNDVVLMPNADVAGLLVVGAADVAGPLTAGALHVAGAVTSNVTNVAGLLTAGAVDVAGALTAGTASVAGALAAGTASVAGALTVGALIGSPTGLQCRQQASSPVAAVAGTGTYWVQTHTPTNPMFTDSSGASTLLLPVMSDYVSVLQYGAVGDGATDCTAAFVAAAAVAGRNVYLPRGVYVVGTVTFTTSVQFSPGASMSLLAPSSVWTFSGGLEAQVVQIFRNLPAWTPPAQAPVVVNQAVNTDGWVDWFGTDAAAIEACHKVFTVTRLQAETYTVTRTVVLDQSFRQVVGAYGDAEGRGGTCIVLTGGSSATATVVQVGAASAAAIPLLTRKLEVSWINTRRDGPCTLSASRYAAAVGWSVQGLYEGYLFQLYDFGSATSYRITACVAVTLERCNCVNVTPAVGGTGGDNYTAFLVGGSSANFFFVGANASLLLLSCTCDGGSAIVGGPHGSMRQVGASGVYTPTSGVYLYGYIADTWINQFEASNLSNGLVVDGNDALGAQVTAQYSQQDVFIDRAVLDAMQLSAMRVQNLNSDSMVEISDAYLATNTDVANQPGNGLLITACTGAIFVTGGIMLSSSASTVYGISIQTSSGVTVQGPLLKNYTFALFCANSSGIWANALLTRTLAGTESAVYLANVTRSYFAPTVTGVANSWVYGFLCPNDVTFTETNLSGIQVSSLAVPGSGIVAQSKINYNGATWGGGATYGTNVASGVLG